jgi:hypothetical protein
LDAGSGEQIFKQVHLWTSPFACKILTSLDFI